MSNIKVALQKTFLCITASLALASCSLLDLFDESTWPTDGGVVYIDGVEYREIRSFSFTYPRSRYWGLMREYTPNLDTVYLRYSSDKLVSKDGGEAFIRIRTGIPSAVFNSRNLFTSEDDDLDNIFDENTFDNSITITTKNFYTRHMTSWSLNVMIADTLYSERRGDGALREAFSGNYEYEMIAVDSIGITHQVSGWAEYRGEVPYF